MEFKQSQIMDFTEKSISEFSRDISYDLKSKVISDKKDLGILDCIPIIKGKQCIYVMDWPKYKITYARGVESMLGYEPSEFDMDKALNYIHPDDMKIVSRIVKGTIKNAINIGFEGDDNYALVTYRVQKKDGTYINVLRQSTPWELDENGNLLSSMSFMIDISFISNNNKVEWDIFANGMDNFAFKSNIYKEFVDFFTIRELEIIKCIAKHYTNAQIAEELYISLHTVKTHRKKILKKANCHNRKELLDFCEKNGIV